MVNKAAVFEAMLRSGGWLATLPEAVRQAVFKASSVRTIAPGAALFEQDGPPTGLHGVFSGDIRVVGHSRDGRAEIGRAHVCTPVTNAHLVCRLLLSKNKHTEIEHIFTHNQP